MSDFFVTLS